MPTGFDPVLSDLALLLAVTAFTTAAFRSAGINPLLGLLAAGVALGPAGIGVVEKSGALGILAELGILFLLFAVGLELSGDRIRAMARTIFGFGVLHLASCSLALTLALNPIAGSWTAAGILAAALSMSSTAFVLQLLSARRTLLDRSGRQTFSALIFQDIAVGPLLAAVPAVAAIVASRSSGAPPEPGVSFLVAVIALLVAFVIAKLLLVQMLNTVRGYGREAFPASIVLAALAMGWIALKLGLSPSLGALLAGVALSSATWRHESKEIIHPFEATFLAFFFIGVGTLVPMDGSLPDLLRLAAATLLVVTVKTLAGTLAGIVCSHGWRGSLRVGLNLAQGGEFAFLLLGAFGAAALVPSADVAFWTGAATLSMALTPLLVRLGEIIDADAGGREPVADAGEPADGDRSG